jgi:RNA polymerase sigma-70 factor (ECF subfamily)
MARRRQKIRFDALPEDAGERLPSSEAGPEVAFEQNNLDPEIQRALDALPTDFRAAVVLCDLEGLTYDEIAVTLGVKVGTVRSRIHRGRVLLRQSLAHRAPSAQVDNS